VGREHNAGLECPGQVANTLNRSPSTAIFLHWYPSRHKLSIKIISNLSFIPGNRFNVDELSRERDCVHAGENSKADALSPDPCPLNLDSKPPHIELESES
jgi:hypothetical protein